MATGISFEFFYGKDGELPVCGSPNSICGKFSRIITTNSKDYNKMTQTIIT